MKRRSFLQSLTAIAVAVSIEVLGFKEAWATPDQQECSQEELIKGELARLFPPRRTIQSNGKWATVEGRYVYLYSTKFRIVDCPHQAWSESDPSIPEFKSESGALKWAGVMVETVDPKLITDSYPTVPIPVFPEPPDISTLPRCLPSEEEVSRWMNHSLPTRY